MAALLLPWAGRSTGSHFTSDASSDSQDASFEQVCLAATAGSQAGTQSPEKDADELLPIQKTNCVRCHLTAGRELTVPVRDFARSSHDLAKMSCNDCHGGNTEDDITAHEPEHDFIGTKLSAHMTACADCHYEEAESFRQGPHFWDLEQRINTDYPLCIDCHGNHDVGRPPPGFSLAQVCSDCHAKFAEEQPELAAIVAENDRLWETLRHATSLGENGTPLPPDMRREIRRLRYATAKLIHPAKRPTPEQAKSLNERVRQLKQDLSNRRADGS